MYSIVFQKIRGEKKIYDWSDILLEFYFRVVEPVVLLVFILLLIFYVLPTMRQQWKETKELQKEYDRFNESAKGRDAIRERIQKERELKRKLEEAQRQAEQAEEPTEEETQSEQSEQEERLYIESKLQPKHDNVLRSRQKSVSEDEQQPESISESGSEDHRGES